MVDLGWLASLWERMIQLVDSGWHRILVLRVGLGRLRWAVAVLWAAHLGLRFHLPTAHRRTIHPDSTRLTVLEEVEARLGLAN